MINDGLMNGEVREFYCQIKHVIVDGAVCHFNEKGSAVIFQKMCSQLRKLRVVTLIILYEANKRLQSRRTERREGNRG